MPKILTGSPLIGILFLFIFAVSSIVHAYDITLAWDPNDEPDLAGYSVYVNEGGSSAAFQQMDSVSLDIIEPENPRYFVTGLQNDVNYCFAVAAYNMGGSESDFSNTVCVLNGWVNTSQDIVIDATQRRSEMSGGCFIETAAK